MLRLSITEGITYFQIRNIRGLTRGRKLPSLPSKLKRLGMNKIMWMNSIFCINSDFIPHETTTVLGYSNISSLHGKW
ncbi:hypothetical protein IEQ34_003485 [Dendrobium chrysotoxum]|uniref:Uncharacterized protein n=1 Tax=Dendrobium chrysotoxum TaxID=161865 RepID=A0AAV7HKT1_DENCH|nr:hypothetical protein IEQ34_003485 [Dendrobium chrysotoxum]